MAFDFKEYIEENLDFREQLSKNEELQIDCINPECDDNWRRRKKMAVNTEKQVAYCFKCGKVYYAIDFVAEVEGISRFAAMKIVKDGAPKRTYGPNRLEKAIEEYLERKAKKAEPEPEPELEPCLFPPLYHIEPGTPEWEYLQGRNFGKDVIKHFGLYYCDRGTAGTLCSNCPIKERGKRCCPYFGRIIIPVYYEGVPIAFQGRTIRDAVPKYLFPIDQNFSTALYNWDHAKKHEELILVEGVTDAWRLWSLGFPNVCATFGKSLKAAQRRLIKGNSGIKRVYLFWDGEALDKIYTAADSLTGSKEVYAVELPPEMEPDTCPDPQSYIDRAVLVNGLSPLRKKLRAKRLASKYGKLGAIR